MLRIPFNPIGFLLILGTGSPSPSRDFLNLKINQDSTTEVQNEEQIVVNPINGQNLVAVWRDFRLGYRQVGYGASLDGGFTWTEDLLMEPRFIWQSDPGLTADVNGNFYAVVLSFNPPVCGDSNGIFVMKSTDGGLTWGPAYPAIIGDDTYFHDKELMTCDRSKNLTTRGNLYVSWTRFLCSSSATDIFLIRSTNGGTIWLSPVQVSDFSGSYVQWPLPVVGANGEVYVGWYQDFPTQIRLDVSTNGGVTFGSDRTIVDLNTYYGDINGGILVFPFPAMDADLSGGPFNGNLYVAYMDFSGTDMDLFFTRSTDQGMTWSPPFRVNDDPTGNGRDQFHPWLTVDQNGTITIVFYDRRLDPGNLLFDLYMTQSFDGGATFTPNERITNVSSVPLSLKTDLPAILSQNWKRYLSYRPAGLIGEYIGIASYYGELHPIWTDTRNGNQDVYTAVDTSQIRDVEVSSISSPGDTVYCRLMTPIQSTVCNRGNRIESFDVIAEIPSFYSDTVRVMGLQPDSCEIISFQDWLVPDIDSTCYTLTVSIKLPIDESPENDSLSKIFCAFCIPIRDVGVVSIDLPDTVPCDTPTIIPVTVCNFGDSAENFLIGCELSCRGSSNSQATFIDLLPDSCKTVNFDFTSWVSWPDSECCNIEAYTSLSNDLVPDNDTLEKTVCSICPVGIYEGSLLPQIPSFPRLLQNIPNPFFSTTLIRFIIPAVTLNLIQGQQSADSGKLTAVSLAVYDITGRLVKIFEEGNREKGDYQILWDGREEDGKKVPSGIYFYKLKMEGFSETRKMILLR